MTINRFCSSGLQAIAIAAERIRAGAAHAIIAGGAESMSMTARGGVNLAPNPWFVNHWPDYYLTMGLTAERLQRRYGVTRAEADEFALASHRKAVAARDAGRFDDEIVPVEAVNVTLEEDEGPRADTTLESLAQLKPVFHAKGTVTAGNSSQASDGAAAALVMSETRARELGFTPKARFVCFAAAGVPPDIMGIGPVVAIPKALALAGLTMDDIDVIELNEAFAVQALTVIKLAHLDAARINPNGGAVALGHPLGATGAKLTATLLRELDRREGRYGMVTMCVGGGQGAAGIFERW
jgi:acetyl-CoA acyltransferase